MFEDMKHRDGCTTGGSQRRPGKCRADGGDTGAAPGYIGGVERKIEADDAFCSTLGEHLKEETATAADVEDEAGFFRFAQRAFDEAEMVAEDEAAINLFQAGGSVGVRGVPISGRIVIAQLQRMRLRIETDEAAMAAFDNAENFVRRPVEAVRAGEQQARFAMSAGGARIGSGDGAGSYVDISDSSRRGIR
jgi:hypothetical protein